MAVYRVTERARSAVESLRSGREPALSRFRAQRIGDVRARTASLARAFLRPASPALDERRHPASCLRTEFANRP
jgi:hypothetical protein